MEHLRRLNSSLRYVMSDESRWDLDYTSECLKVEKLWRWLGWKESTNFAINTRLILHGRDLKIGKNLCSVALGSGCCYFIVPSGACLCPCVSPHWQSSTNHKHYNYLEGDPSVRFTLIMRRASTKRLLQEKVLRGQQLFFLESQRDSCLKMPLCYCRHLWSCKGIFALNCTEL
jgi:hypothetical protein